jgi:hypothetical protein
MASRSVYRQEGRRKTPTVPSLAFIRSLRDTLTDRMCYFRKGHFEYYKYGHGPISRFNGSCWLYNGSAVVALHRHNVAIVCCITFTVLWPRQGVPFARILSDSESLQLPNPLHGYASRSFEKDPLIPNPDCLSGISKQRGWLRDVY